MTGKDLIVYILVNDLEDVPVYENGRFMGFMTDSEAAEKFEVGTATIRAWIEQGLLYGVKIGDTMYIPQNATNPKKLINNME